MTYAHVGATQACRNSTDTRTNSAPQACSESRLFTNPSIPPHFAVRLCWSVRATEQSVYGSAMSHLVFYAFFFRCGVKEGIDYVEFLFFPSFPSKFFVYEGFGSWKKSPVSAPSSYAASNHPHQVFLRGWSADLLWSGVYPAVSRFANVENCTLKPERLNLRFVSCFLNVNIKGQKICKTRTFKWAKLALSNESISALMFTSKNMQTKLSVNKRAL